MSLKESMFEIVNERPILKEMLTMFDLQYSNRLFVNVTDSVTSWQNDLCIAERLMGSMLLVPVHLLQNDEFKKCWDQTLDVLKQRMKYPGVKEDANLLKLAKTWVLPSKLDKLESADALVDFSYTDFHGIFAEKFTSLNIQENKIHFLKVELQNGMERILLYKLLDSGFRPSLLLVKWSEDMDSHTPTAYCAGHVVNSGYSLVKLYGSYALYFYTDQPLYDICSLKVESFKNPIMDSLLQSITDVMKIETQEPVKKDEPTAEKADSSTL